MLDRGRLLFLFCSFLVIALVATGSLVAASAREDSGADDSPYKFLSVFLEVFGLIDKAYVDEPDESVLLAGAFEGAVDALDPFSLYVPKEAVPGWQSARSIGTEHSGLLVLKERGVAFAVAVEEGSPADRAGIEAGDILAAIDGRRTRREPLYEIHRMLSAPAGTTMDVELLRRGRKSHVDLVLGEYPRPAVSLSVEDGVPVLRIPSLDEGAATDVAGSLEALRGGSLDGVESTDRLLIDLRGVAGGSKAEAFAIADLLTQGDLGTLVRRDETLETYRADDEPSWSGRLVLLVNRSTQGAAEVLATVLRQTAEAQLVGERTFGHAGRLHVIDLSDGGQLQITTAFYTGPDLEPIHTSLQPDHRVRSFVPAPVEPIEAEGDDAAGEDAVGEAAAEPNAVDEPADDAGEAGDGSVEDGLLDDSLLDEADPVLERGLEILLQDDSEEAELEAVAA
ncbi:MAG: S41 family peptidase [Acidobacteriota bacterium]